MYYISIYLHSWSQYLRFWDRFEFIIQMLNHQFCSGRSLPIRCRMAGGWRLMEMLYLGVMEHQHSISLTLLHGKVF